MGPTRSLSPPLGVIQPLIPFQRQRLSTTEQPPLFSTDRRRRRTGSITLSTTLSPTPNPLPLSVVTQRTVPPALLLFTTLASSGANPARDPPSQKPPVYYHVLQNPSGRAEEVKYHTLEEPPGHRYHVLEQTGETNTASGGGPMYSEVGQRRAATLQPHQHPPSSSNPNISLPRNLTRSTTLL